MYLKKKELIITDLNVWFKNWKVWAIVEYVDFGKVFKLFMDDEDQVCKFFGLSSFPRQDQEVKNLKFKK